MNKKILFVNSKFGFFGGVERYIFDTATVLRANGWQCYGFFESRTDRIEGFDEPFESFDVGGDYDGYLETIKNSGVDVAFMHKISEPNLLKNLNERFKTVVFVHDHDYYCLRRHKYFPLSRKNCSFAYNPVLCGLCSGLIKKDNDSPIKVSSIDIGSYRNIFKELKKSDGYIVMSEFMKHNLVINGFEQSKISKLYPVKEPHSIASSPDSEEILYIGQIIRGKGVDLLVEAMRKVKSSCRLRIVGTGNDVGYIKSLIDSYGLGGRVKMLGWCGDVESCYRDSDIVVVPSRWQEPFGMIGVEAFSYGRPVVGFDVGGIGEWLKDEDNGFLVKSGDVNSLAQKIEQLLDDSKLRQRMGRNGYDMVKKEYGKDMFMDRFNSIMSALTGGSDV